MTVIKGWTMTPKSLTEEGNKMKEVFLESMKSEGHITQEQLDTMNRYTLIIAEKSYFGKVWDKLLWKDDPESVKIIVVKILD